MHKGDRGHPAHKTEIVMRERKKESERDAGRGDEVE